jgi:predicted PurR-regulated permease PerM
MENIKENDGGNSVNFIVLLAALFVVIAGLKMSQSLIVPILLSVFIAIISAPALFWLESKKVPRILAFIIVVVVVLGVLSMVGMVIGNSINDFMSNLPEYEKNLSTIPDKIGKFAARFKLPFFERRYKSKPFKTIGPFIYFRIFWYNVRWAWEFII